jgi:hypothetical protein
MIVEQPLWTCSASALLISLWQTQSTCCMQTEYTPARGCTCMFLRRCTNVPAPRWSRMLTCCFGPSIVA